MPLGPLLAAALLVSAPADDGALRLRGSPLPAVGRAKVYVGKEGVAVEMARVVGRDQALVRVAGVDDPADGRVLRCDVVETAGGAQLWTKLGGRRVAVLAGTPDDDGALVWELELPSMKRPLRLAFDAARTARADARTLALDERR